MIWCVEYNEKNGIAEKDVVNIYDVDEEGFTSTDSEIGEVYKSQRRFYVFIKAGTKKFALERAQELFADYFEYQATKAKDYISLKIDEVKEFVVGDAVRVVRPGQQFTTHFEAMGGLLSDAFNFGYRGEFTVGGSITKYDLKTTTFTVIGKGRFDANGGENMTLYMIAESVNAEQHDWHKGFGKTREPLEVFVLCKEGLERW